jgi:hypothetical protein
MKEFLLQLTWVWFWNCPPSVARYALELFLFVKSSDVPLFPSPILAGSFARFFRNVPHLRVAAERDTQQTCWRSTNPWHMQVKIQEYAVKDWQRLAPSLPPILGPLIDPRGARHQPRWWCDAPMPKKKPYQHPPISPKNQKPAVWPIAHMLRPVCSIPSASTHPVRPRLIISHNRPSLSTFSLASAATWRWTEAAQRKRPTPRLPGPRTPEQG